MSIPKCKCGRPVEFRGTLLYEFCYDCWWAQDVRNTSPTEKQAGKAPRSVSRFKPGDRVKIYSPSNQLLMYEGLQRGATGTVRRLIAGMVRVEIDGTGSQDSEGHNAFSDFIPSELTKIPAYGSENTKVSRGPMSKYNAFNQPTPTEKPQGAAAVPPRIREHYYACGLKHEYVPVNSDRFEEIKNSQWLGAEWLSLAEHQEILAAAEARHKELMERAVGEAFTRGRLHECQDQLWKHVHADSPAATYWAEKVDDLHALLEARAASSPGDEK